jgi:hypothetical protein
MNESEIMAVEGQPAPPPPKKCDIGRILGKTILELIVAAPANPVARALVMSRIKQEIPPGLPAEYTAIKEWIEATIDEKTVTPIQVPAAGPARGRPSPIAFSIEVSASETETGSCSYSCDNSGSCNYEYSQAEILEWVEDAIDNDGDISTVVTRMVEDAEENAMDSINMEQVGYDYSNHNATSSELNSLDISSRDAQRTLKEWLDVNHPVLLRRLEGLEDEN